MPAGSALAVDRDDFSKAVTAAIERRFFAQAQPRGLTLVYSARDEAHNQAVVIREVLVG